MSLNRRMASVFVVMTVFTVMAGGQSPQDLDAQRLAAKERKEQEKKRRKEETAPWKAWLNQDVVYIAADEEKAAFRRLQTNNEREQFAAQFWLRRDASPRIPRDAFQFKEEHYRRIAYANEQFASRVPGWKTDRGMAYIAYGPPDEIEAQVMADRTHETWHYRHPSGFDRPISIEFADSTGAGDYRVVNRGLERDPMLYVPGPGIGWSSSPEEMLGLPKRNVFMNGALPTGLVTNGVPYFWDLERQIKLNHHPDELPTQLRLDSIRVTEATAFVVISIDLGSVSKMTVNILGVVSAPSGNETERFVGMVTLPRPVVGYRTYSRAVSLVSGRYHLDLVAKDVGTGAMTRLERDLIVPPIHGDALTASSVILAESLEGGDVLLRSTRLSPRASGVFKRGESLGVYAEFYGLGLDEKTGRPRGTVEYNSTNDEGERVLHSTEALAARSAWLAIAKRQFALSAMKPGRYRATVTLADAVRDETMSAVSDSFLVTE